LEGKKEEKFYFSLLFIIFDQSSSAASFPCVPESFFRNTIHVFSSCLCSG